MDISNEKIEYRKALGFRRSAFGHESLSQECYKEFLLKLFEISVAPSREIYHLIFSTE